MADTAAFVAQNPAAPAEERYDATADFAKSHGSIQQALQLDLEPGAAASPCSSTTSRSRRRAYWDRPGILGFDAMRAMVEQTPILNGIVLTRIRQVHRFCRPRMGTRTTPAS
jgi:hypothetical protein